MNDIVCVIEPERIESLRADVAPAKASLDVSAEYLKGVQDGLGIAYDYITRCCVLFNQANGETFSWPEKWRQKGYELVENMDIDIRH